MTMMTKEIHESVELHSEALRPTGLGAYPYTGFLQKALRGDRRVRRSRVVRRVEEGEPRKSAKARLRNSVLETAHVAAVEEENVCEARTVAEKHLKPVAQKGRLRRRERMRRSATQWRAVCEVTASETKRQRRL